MNNPEDSLDWYRLAMAFLDEIGTDKGRPYTFESQAALFGDL